VGVAPKGCGFSHLSLTLVIFVWPFELGYGLIEKWGWQAYLTPAVRDISFDL